MRNTPILILAGLLVIALTGWGQQNDAEQLVEKAEQRTGVLVEQAEELANEAEDLSAGELEQQARIRLGRED